MEDKVQKAYNEAEKIGNKITKRFICIMIFYTLISFLPTLIFIQSVDEAYQIWLVFASLFGAIFGMYITPWTYRKIFKG